MALLDPTVAQNWWQGNQFMMPGFQMPAPQFGLLAQQPSTLGILGVQQARHPAQPAYEGDGDNGVGDSTGAAPDSTGSVGIGIGPASGSPGTGGLAGLAGAVASVVAPAVANVASQVATGKGIGENVTEALADMGMSQNPTVAQGANAAAAEANAAGPGTGAVGGVAGVGANVGTNADPEASVADPGGAGGSAGGGAAGDSTVICTMLHQMGHISDAVYAADAEYGRNADRDLIVGYHFWAKPYVLACRGNRAHNRCALGLAKLFAIPWANEMAYRAGVLPQGSRLGAFLFSFGVPLCRLLGKLINATVSARAVKA